MSLGRKNVSYTVLERDAQSNRQVYESLLAREKELRVHASSRGNNVRLVEEAEIPGGPFSPNLRRSMLLASLVGLTLAFGLVFVLGYLDDTIKTPEDIANKLNAPFLGLVPKVKAGLSPLLTAQSPHEFGEAFRSLRTALAFSSSGTGGRVILVTSSQPLEGKTTTACNMAIALSLSGDRVLLIDADLRRPNVAKTLGLEATTGLSHLLTGQATPRDAIWDSGMANLWVMTSGHVPPNPSELLASQQMGALLNPANGWFDWIIVDAPPVLAVTDAVILAPMVSGVAFVVRSELTPQRHVKRALETLMTGQPRLLGLVLNGVDLERNKFYYSRYYGYEHTHYYSAPAAS
jgi:capsular exopolysaccharide synthesis family protein